MPRQITDQEKSDLEETVAKSIKRKQPGLKVEDFDRMFASEYDRAYETLRQSPEPLKESALERIVNRVGANLAGFVQMPVTVARAALPEKVVELGTKGLAYATGNDPQAAWEAMQTNVGKFGPVNFLKETHEAAAQQAEKARAAYQGARTPFGEGGLATALEMGGHGAAAAIPFFGPFAADVGERLASGDIAGGVTDIGMTFGAPKLIEKAHLPPFKPTTPELQAAVTYAQKEGVPLTASSATGSPVVLKLQRLAAGSVFGESAATPGLRAERQGMMDLSKRLAEKTGVGPQTQLTAGEAQIRDVVGKRDLAAEAATEKYGVMETELAKPQYTKTVPTDTPESIAAKAEAVRRNFKKTIGYVPHESVINELKRMWVELYELPYQAGKLVEDPKTGESYYVGRTPGAKVIEDIAAKSPGGSESIPRPAAKDAIVHALESGDFSTDIAKGALRVAEARLDGRFKTPGNPHGVNRPEVGEPFKAEDVIGQFPQQKPGMTEMQLPIDVGFSKDFLRPFYQEQMRKWDATKGPLNPALAALGELLDGPNYVAFADLEKNIGTLKRFAAGKKGDLISPQQRVALKTLSTLEENLKGTAKVEAPDVYDPLIEARQFTTRKFDYDKLRKGLGTEPVKAVRKLIQEGDANIDWLRKIQKASPDVVKGPLARAVLDDVTRRASRGKWPESQGGWAKLGDETKKILYGTGEYRKNLELVYGQLWPEVNKNPNPSGSGGMVATGGEAVSLMTRFGRQILTSMLMIRPMARLLHSPDGAKLLTDGLRIPGTDKASLATWMTKVQNRLQQEQKADEQEQAQGTP
jgi:phosphohistidine phosphatase SixA